jgi:hypothetical protein
MAREEGSDAHRGSLGAKKGDGLFAIAHAILKLADAQQNLATHVKYLGNGDAATTMGAIEAFGMHIGEKLDAITSAILSDSRAEQ